jgi:peptide/nickel transport system ATP-binding protein
VDAPLLEVEGLSVEIPTVEGALHAVRDVSFSISSGRTLSIVGESGCGKSMTALALMDLLPRGARRSVRRLIFEGEDLTAVPAVRLAALRGARIAMVFQDPMTALNPAFTIGEQLIEVHRRHKRSSRRQARERAVELLQKVGIPGAGRRLGQHPHELSGGLRQRVMIAMALMCEPSLLIADEPTTALDVTIQAQILRLLVDLQRDLGIAMLLITHDLGVVARVAQSVVVMYAGEIVETAPTAELLTAPRHPYTRGLMASVPVPGRTRPGEPLAVIPGVVPAPIGEMRGCAFRNRCSFALAACSEPVEWRVEGAHGWRCVHRSLSGAGP